MGASNVKEALYQSIENSDERKLAFILKEHPELLNSPITDDCMSTALTRSVWRNDFKLVTLLLGMGCRVNYSGPRGISPLMWASKRGHLEMAKFLIENGADLLEKSNDKDGFTALDMAIVVGQYEMCLYLLSLDLSQLETLRKPEVYLEGAKGKYLSYCNYELFLDHLKARIPLDACPNFFKRPPCMLIFEINFLLFTKYFKLLEPELVDPVIDPRETWSQFIKRNIEFEDPPMVERTELPATLQPQNRFFGRMRSYINGQTPYQAQSVQAEEDKDKIIPKDQQQIELQEDYPNNKNQGEENNKINIESTNIPFSGEMRAAQQSDKEINV